MLYCTLSLSSALLALTLSLSVGDVMASDSASSQVTVDWTNIVFTSRSTPTLQVVVNPPLRRGSAIHDPVYKALRDLGAVNVRYVPWLP